MDPSSHHAFSRQLACMAGHAYPHSTPPQHQCADPLGMMDNPKMGPMMRALTEDDMIAQHQQQMAIAQGMYPQNSYPGHQMHHPFSPGRNPPSMPFYPQAHSAEYAAAIQGGGYGISPTGYYQRQIPTPSPGMGGGGLGSPNGHQASPYPRSASAGPTIPSPIMMQGSSVYSNSSMYGVLPSTSPQLSHSSSSLPPRSMRSPAGLQSPKSLPTSSPVPFSCSSPSAVNSVVYGHNLSSTASDRQQQQFAVVSKSPGMGQTFQYSPYVNPQGPIHPMSAATRSRPMDQTDGVRSPPYVELIHSKSPPSPLDKHQGGDHHQSVPDRRNGSTPQRSGKRRSNQGSLPRLEEMVAFLGEPVMNATHDPQNPSMENHEMEALMRESIPDIDGGNIPRSVSQQEHFVNDDRGQFDGCRQQGTLAERVGASNPGSSRHRTQMEPFKPSPLVVLPQRNNNQGNTRPEQEPLANHSVSTSAYQRTQESMGGDGTRSKNGPTMGMVVNGGGSGPSAPPSPLQIKQSAEEKTLRREQELYASSSPSPPSGGEWTTDRPGDDNRTVVPSEQHFSESGAGVGSDEMGDRVPVDDSTGSGDSQLLLDRGGATAGGRSQDGESGSQTESGKHISQDYNVGRNQTGNQPHRTPHENCLSHASIPHPVRNTNGGGDKKDTSSLEQNVAKKDVKGVVTLVPNSPEVSKVPHDRRKSDDNENGRTRKNQNAANGDGNDRGCTDQGDSLERRETFREDLQQSRKCEVRLNKNFSIVGPVCDIGEEEYSLSIPKQPVTVKFEPQSVVRLEWENATDNEVGSPSKETSIMNNDLDKVVESPDQATIVTEPIKNNVMTTTPVSEGQLSPSIVSPEGLESIPVIIAKKSTPIRTEGTDEVGAKQVVQGEPFKLKVNPVGQRVRTPTSGAGKTQMPVFLVATGESKLKMNAASVVITPLKMSDGKSSSADSSKKRSIEETSSGDQPASFKKRPVKSSPGRSSTPKRGKSTPLSQSKGQSSSSGQKRCPATDSPSGDSLADPAGNPSGDQSTLPLKKRRGRPFGSKNRAKRGETPSKSGGRKSRTSKHGSEEEEELSKFRHVQSLKKGMKPKRRDSPSRGPLLRVTGHLEDVLSCKVINSSSDGAGPSKSKRVSRVLSIPSSVTTKGPTSDASTITVHPKGTWLCAFCGKQSFFGALGVLFGPYYPTGLHKDHMKGMEKTTPKTKSSQARALVDKKMPSKSPPKRDRRSLKTYPGKTKNGPTFLSEIPPPRNSKVLKVHLGSGRGESSRSHSGPTSPRSRAMEMEREEVWVHEDCLVWSQGVFSVGGTLYGLHAAVKEAMTVVCTRCHGTGATLGCRAKGCNKAFHYLCAIEVECLLHEDNFSMTCPQHKNKKLKMREDPT